MRDLFKDVSEIGRLEQAHQESLSDGPQSEIRTSCNNSYIYLSKASNGNRVGVVTTTADEFGPDPDIELGDEAMIPVTSTRKSTSTEPELHPTSRKRKQPEPVVSGKKGKLPLLSCSGEPFDFAEKVVTSGIETTSCTEAPVVRARSSEATIHAQFGLPTATITTATVGATTEIGIQCSMSKGKTNITGWWKLSGHTR